MNRLILLALMIILIGLFGAAPPKYHKPFPDIMPPRKDCFYRADRDTGKHYTWHSNPRRKTLYWRGPAGLLFCDDPDCIWCREEVYGYDTWPNPPIKIRR